MKIKTNKININNIDFLEKYEEIEKESIKLV